ncbi:hypothetical protein KIW84_013288 [Lathyrus oleraceus]|uniref:Uncharacterized protein n=1 Tax=Pisum sativum TaxID=3888 RepID=A0A9D5BJY5_PEA|nr:hypothetical protein KIW84_013288 [Pisum sativum]
MSAFTGCRKSSPSIVESIMAPPENVFLTTNGPSYVGVHLPLGSPCGRMIRLSTKLEAAEKWKVEKRAKRKSKGKGWRREKLGAQRFAGLIRSGSPPTAENAENSAFCLVLAQEQLFVLR